MFLHICILQHGVLQRCVWWQLDWQVHKVTFSPSIVLHLFDMILLIINKDWNDSAFSHWYDSFDHGFNLPEWLFWLFCLALIDIFYWQVHQVTFEFPQLCNIFWSFWVTLLLDCFIVVLWVTKLGLFVLCKIPFITTLIIKCFWSATQFYIKDNKKYHYNFLAL